MKTKCLFQQRRSVCRWNKHLAFICFESSNHSDTSLSAVFVCQWCLHVERQSIINYREIPRFHPCNYRMIIEGYCRIATFVFLTKIVQAHYNNMFMNMFRRQLSFTPPTCVIVSSCSGFERTFERSHLRIILYCKKLRS